MSHVEVSSSKEPIRLFKSNFLEFFTHIHPAVVLAIWAPTAIYFLARAIVRHVPGTSPLTIPLGFLIGVFLWTLLEYTLHRFVFHFPARTPRQERVAFMIHGIHHAQPMVKTRLVMPPAVSIPLALLVYGLLYLVLGVALRVPHWIAPIFSGIISGYLAYDMLHYSIHHFAMRRGVLKFLRLHHVKHHAQPLWRFGVSSPLWDIVFGTEPA
jgi:sterol desaturase/sphingolipid hydroxylase (fatty acid hydroxylase superfamily)